MTCAAVIPCFNEGLSIGPLIAGIREFLPPVIVVDDGSTDNTAVAAADAGAMVVKHAQNFGKGAALRTGLSRAADLGFEWVVTLDGDGQHVPSDLPALLGCASHSGASLVIGNRMHNAHAIPWLRRWVNRLMSRLLSRRAGRDLPDTQCGFRVVRLKTWANLSLNTEHFEIESEMLMAFLAAKHPVAFAPIQVIGRGQRSRIRPFADTVRWWKWWRSLEQVSPRPLEIKNAPAWQLR